ncbi:MAG: type II toxin-antitoxin system RelB/DinJ family antitoxin [Oscillospiraceae bacterium]|nr:type II toxin-antitoxin system RelB/DinJ family antitoxin [Oscillospiraceae bacterium]
MAQISIRMDEELRKQTDKILNELGLNLSSAINIFARQIVRIRGIPFPLTLPDQISANQQETVNRQEAIKSFIQFANSHPIKFDEGFKFSREECYEDE